MNSSKFRKLVPVLALVPFILLASIGCPPPQQQTKVSVLFTGDGSGLAKKLLSLIVSPGGLTKQGGPVDIEAIKSLTVTINEVVLRRAPGSGGGTPNVVEVSNHQFDPDSISVGVGDTVTWLWIEDGEHSITNSEVAAAGIVEGGLFDETRTMTGEMVDVEFTTTGLFPYFSKVPDDVAESMAGVVEVTPEGENDGDGMGSPGNRISIIPDGDGLVIDLLQLQNLSVLLSTSSLPSGKYTGIELIISNPVLVLKDDETTEIMDIKLTANGRLFISKNFDVPDTGPQVITIDFGGIHLTQRGSGSFNLTPQLRAIISVEAAEVTTTGAITSIDGNTITLDIGPDSDPVVVDVSAALIFLADTTEGDVSDLAEDQVVTVEGTLQPGGAVVATSVTIQP